MALDIKCYAPAVLAAATLLLGTPALAQWKPTKPIEIIVHTGPGGGADVLARFVAQVVEKDKLAPVRMIVQNKPGGGGLVAMNHVVERKGDTHAIALFTSNWMTNPLTQSEAKVTVKDMTPVVRLMLDPAVIAVKPDSPFKTVKDFIDAAKANPGKLKQSGGSITSRDNVIRQLMMKKTGTQWAFISFPGGGERIAALLGGHAELMILEPQEAGDHLRAGTMRMLAQVVDKRLPGFPNVPTLKEAGIEIPNVSQARGVLAPPGIPAEVVAYYEALFARFVETPAWKKYLIDNHIEAGFLKSGELSTFMDKNIAEMREILRETGAKVVR